MGDGSAISHMSLYRHHPQPHSLPAPKIPGRPTSPHTAKVHCVTETPPRPPRRSPKPHLIHVGLGLAFILVLGTLVRRSDFDYAITHAFNAQRSESVAAIVDTIYLALKVPYAFYLLAACAILIGVVSSSARTGLIFVATVGLAWLPIPFFKDLFSRPRPDASLMENPSDIIPTDLSFPSGHTAFVSALAIALALALSPYVRRRYCYAFAAIMIATIVVVVMTTGVHFPTDTLGSIVWTLAATPAFWHLLTRTTAPLPQKLTPAPRTEQGGGQ